MRGLRCGRLRGGILALVDRDFIIKWLSLFDPSVRLSFLDLKLLRSVQLLRILTGVLSRYNRSGLLLIEV